VRIYALFIIRNGLDEYPELAVAWDDASVDNWYEGWESAQQKALDSIGSDLQSSAVVYIDIPESKVIEALHPTVVVKGEVVVE